MDEAEYNHFFSAEARASSAQMADDDAARHAATRAERAAQEAVFLASNPWPIDASAGRAMGLYEYITERGD